MWEVVIADNGIGIDPKHAERVFKMFQRLHGRDEYPGTGIGLAIVKKIAERHGGDVAVFPVAAGGSEFRVTLPVRDFS
jgi:signal transduction histidine kinase